MKKQILLCLFAGILLNAQAQVKMMVLSDPHVLDTALYDNQASFSSDPKLVEHSLELFDIALNRIVAAQPDILLIPGDLTKDGELASHQYVANKLNALSGIRVFVVPGNHDLTNPTAQSYLNGTHQTVANVNAEQFRSIYANMGYSNAALYSADSLSYLTWANDTLAILGLNSTQPNTTGRASAGGLTTEILDFVDSAMAVVRQHGGQVIAMMHHQLVEHFDGEATVANTYVCNTDTSLYISRDSVHRRLMQAGISVMLTGHFHIHSIQRVTPEALELSDTLPTLTDISTGSLCSWPSPIRTLVLNGEELNVTTDTIGTYQAEGMARNANTVKGAINTIGPKLYTKLPELMSKVGISQTTINKIIPATQTEFIQKMHFRLDDAGTLLLNTLARGDEQLPEHQPEYIKDSVRYSVSLLIWDFIPEYLNDNPYVPLVTSYGPADAGKILILVPFIQELAPQLIDPILYNYVCTSNSLLDKTTNLGDNFGLMDLLDILSDDAVRDTVPDWELSVPTIHYEAQGMATAIFDTERIADSTQKIMRNGMIYVRKWDKTFTLKGEEIQ